MSTFAAWITYGTFVIATTFIVCYAWWTRGRWRDTVMGWHLMAIAGSEAWVFGLLVLAHIFPGLGRYSWFRWLYLVSVASIGLITLWRLIILFTTHRPVKRGDGEKTPAR